MLFHVHQPRAIKPVRIRSRNIYPERCFIPTCFQRDSLDHTFQTTRRTFDTTRRHKVGCYGKDSPSRRLLGNGDEMRQPLQQSNTFRVLLCYGRLFYKLTVEAHRAITFSPSPRGDRPFRNPGVSPATGVSTVSDHTLTGMKKTASSGGRPDAQGGLSRLAEKVPSRIIHTRPY